MNLKCLPQAFSVCQVSDLSGVDFTRGFIFVAKTDEELSLVCEAAFVPPAALNREDGWRAFRVSGVLEFSLVGILAKIAGLLANEGISIFAVSTFNTDYILVKSGSFDHALDALAGAGYAILE